MTVRVPTINDAPKDFNRLFVLWQHANDSPLVTFDFTDCRFLRPNAVAFLGGLTRLIEDRKGKVVFDLDTMRVAIRANLAQNGFLSTFGYGSGPWEGNSIPYREDNWQNKDAIIDYLQTKWLGRGWLNISQRLCDAIVGRVWETYANAFEHRQSPIGVFSCGQHFPQNRELKLAVVDFGVGIPSNVRFFTDNQHIVASRALQWAFQRGTSTKPNGAGRGLGLDFLKEFVKVNRGRLEIFSHEGYALITRDEEKYLNRATWFEGTLINITLQCDESYYQFASESVDRPLFG